MALNTNARLGTKDVGVWHDSSTAEAFLEGVKAWTRLVNIFMTIGADLDLDGVTFPPFPDFPDELWIRVTLLTWSTQQTQSQQKDIWTLLPKNTKKPLLFSLSMCSMSSWLVNAKNRLWSTCTKKDSCGGQRNILLTKSHNAFFLHKLTVMFLMA